MQLDAWTKGSTLAIDQNNSAFFLHSSLKHSGLKTLQDHFMTLEQPSLEYRLNLNSSDRTICVNYSIFQRLIHLPIVGVLLLNGCCLTYPDTTIENSFIQFFLKLTECTQHCTSEAFLDKLVTGWRFLIIAYIYDHIFDTIYFLPQFHF